MFVRLFQKFTLSSLLSLLLISISFANEIVLTSWNDFSSGYGNYKFSGSAKSSDGGLPDVAGNLWGGSGARNTWGSTDGTYGSTTAVGNSDTNGTMAIRTDSDKIDFTIVNNTPGSLKLSSILFDFASVNGNSPRNLKLYYLSGGLNIPNSTLIQSWNDIHNGLGIISDYEDVDVDLSGLADQTLASGQTATFRFQVDTANNQTQAMMLDNIAIMGSTSELRVLTYNIHGGEGPNGEGDIETNLEAFRDTFMKEPDVLCLQEVGSNSAAQTASDWIIVKNVFSDYPHTYQTVNDTTAFIWPWQTRKQTSIAILSKYPLETTHSQLIQTDPQGDQWERNAQHVQIKVGEKLVDIFNFHNTYNFFEDDFASEKEGLTKFKTYVLGRVGASSMANAERLLMLGDFNVLQANVEAILAPPSRRSYSLDHVVGSDVFSGGGNYNTIAPALSDHRAVWVSLDLRAPIPDEMTWAAAPAEAGLTSITMTATTASDPNNVEYYFSNATVAGSAHDSGWQSSPTYVDTGLSPATEYTYTVRARDISANANETLLSATAAAYTDDGDMLPNDWELTYFPSLDETSGSPTQDWDGDGSNDIAEWEAGTDPIDKNSIFKSWMEVDAGTGALMIKWSAVPERNYAVYSSSSLTGTWTEITSGITPSGVEGSYQLGSPSDEKKFYRVKVTLPQ